MSLINQMLRDVQKRKPQEQKASTQNSPELRPPEPRRRGSHSSGQLKPKTIERIPLLPLPVVLAGVGLVLACLVWWLAGALSDALFDFEPPARKVVAQAPTASETPVAVAPVETESSAGGAAATETLSEAEREAAPVVAAATAAAKAEPVPTRAAGLTLAKGEKRSSREAATVAGSTPKTVKKELRKAPREAAARRISRERRGTAVVVKQQPAPPRKAQRLDPDELPGAVRSPAPSERTASLPLIARPSAALPSTPYGEAEEAYLDGRWALQRERTALARRSLEHALVVYPGHLPARELLATLLSKQGKSGEAMALLDEGLTIAPDYLPFKKASARLLLEQGDFAAAAKVMLRGGLPSVKQDPAAHVLLASIYDRLGEHFLAAQTYRNLLVEWPKTGAFWVGLGGSLEGQGLPEAALDCYRRALKTEGLRQDLEAFARRRLAQLK
jgi:MSHA biogenesis protein MshN